MKTITMVLSLSTLLVLSLQSPFFTEIMRKQMEEKLPSSATTAPTNSPTDGKRLVWSDEFESDSDKSTLDSTYWTHEIMTGAQSGNNEWEFYTNRMKNSWLQNGYLVIEADKEAYKGFDYTSAKVHSNIGWTFGYFEARAKVPKGEGFWPAIWMLPVEEGAAAYYGPWPAEGEIDIMESINSTATFPDGCQTIHFGGWMHEGTTKKWDTAQAPADNCFPISDWDEFHTWGVDWTAEKIQFYVDGNPTVSVDASQWYSWDYVTNQHYPSPAPFDRQFKWIINFAIGGAWPGYNIDDSALPAQFMIDYVRVYQ